VPTRTFRSSDDSDSSYRRARAARFGCLTLAASTAAALAPVGAGAQNGGTTYVPMPKPSKISCVSQCESKTAVRGGGSLKVSGKALRSVSKVIFVGRRGKRDDVEVEVDPASDRSIKLKVPMAAHTGPLMIWAGERAQAKTKTVKIMPPPPPIKSAELTPSSGPADPGAPPLETGTSDTKYFLGERGGVEFKYRVGGGAPVKAQVTLVRQNDGTIVQTWDAPSVAPGEIQSIRWEGTAAQGAAPEGRYKFLLSVTDGAGAVARSASAEDSQRDAFDLWHYVFPVRGKHDYGQSGARFGAGRSGHSHQGHDVMARCGTRIVAARGGVVKVKGYHSAAGNYIVIDTDGDDVDHAYMHFASPSPLSKGDRVYTNQFVGPNGDTGSATACHLHFEMWSAPGWYDGGQPFDPLPYLQAWDAYS
jgi:murein DD-endopeptidase MepM/ murein hydrolase activator NlpD